MGLQAIPCPPRHPLQLAFEVGATQCRTHSAAVTGNVVVMGIKAVAELESAMAAQADLVSDPQVHK